MKSIATINFKGGVGKTTITWLLAKYVAEIAKKRVLVVDTDAQMSLTLSVQLQETGAMIGEFEAWYENHHINKKKTILKALEQYDKLEGGHFDFTITSSFIYQMSSNLFLFHPLLTCTGLSWMFLIARKSNTLFVLCLAK